MTTALKFFTCGKLCDFGGKAGGETDGMIDRCLFGIRFFIRHGECSQYLDYESASDSKNDG